MELGPTGAAGHPLAHGSLVLDVDGGAGRPVHSSWVVEPSALSRRVAGTRASRAGARVPPEGRPHRGAHAGRTHRGVVPGLVGTTRSIRRPWRAPVDLPTRRHGGVHHHRGAGSPCFPSTRMPAAFRSSRTRRERLGRDRPGRLVPDTAPIRQRAGGAEGVTDGQVVQVSAGNDGSVLAMVDDGGLKRVRRERRGYPVPPIPGRRGGQGRPRRRARHGVDRRAPWHEELVGRGGRVTDERSRSPSRPSPPASCRTPGTMDSSGSWGRRPQAPPVRRARAFRGGAVPRLRRGGPRPAGRSPRRRLGRRPAGGCGPGARRTGPYVPGG